MPPGNRGGRAGRRDGPLLRAGWRLPPRRRLARPASLPCLLARRLYAGIIFSPPLEFQYIRYTWQVCGGVRGAGVASSD